jgi:hypothetical protein
MPEKASASPGSTWLRFERMPFIPRLKSLGFSGIAYKYSFKSKLDELSLSHPVNKCAKITQSVFCLLICIFFGERVLI